jgi:hypothetical protein
MLWNELCSRASHALFKGAPERKWMFGLSKACLVVNLYVHVREDVADVVVQVLLLFFPGLFDIWKIVFLLTLLYQSSAELLLTQQLCWVNNHHGHLSESGSVDHPSVNNNCELYSSTNCDQLSECGSELRNVNKHDLCSKNSTTFYSREQLLSLQSHNVPLDPTVAATLKDLCIRQHVRARRSRAGGRRKQRRIPVLLLGLGATKQ